MAKMGKIADGAVGEFDHDDQWNEQRSSLRRRMNYNFHEDLSDKCQRLLNALDSGAVMPIHHHDERTCYL